MKAYMRKAIYKALRRATRDHALDLEQLIGAIDAQEKSIISLSELRDGLQQLIEEGRIFEAQSRRFFGVADSEAKAEFSGVSEEEYKVALNFYRARMQKLTREMEDKPDRKNDGPLVICWLTFSDGFADESEEAAENLAELIDPIIPKIANADIIGFEPSNDGIRILIYGSGTNAEVDLIYSAIAPVFRAFAKRAGSCILRYYDNRRREVVSDLVTEALPTRL